MRVFMSIDRTTYGHHMAKRRSTKRIHIVLRIFQRSQSSSSQLVLNYSSAGYVALWRNVWAQQSFGWFFSLLFLFVSAIPSCAENRISMQIILCSYCVQNNTALFCDARHIKWHLNQSFQFWCMYNLFSLVCSFSISMERRCIFFSPEALNCPYSVPMSIHLFNRHWQIWNYFILEQEYVFVFLWIYLSHSHERFLNLHATKQIHCIDLK